MGSSGAPDALLGIDEVAAKGRKPRVRKVGPVVIAEVDPVARVLLDLQPAHLDREYDYLVPAKFDAEAKPGVRVRVRFGAQDVDGYIVQRTSDSDHEGALQPLRRVVSPEVVLTPAVLELVRAVADHWAGITSDVLRLAIPPRHARTESEAQVELPAAAGGAGEATRNEPSRWAPYVGGAAFLERVAAGESPKAVWTSMPGVEGTVPHWAAAIAEAVVVAAKAGRGVLAVVPDVSDVARVEAAIAGRVAFARLVADDGPAERYRQFLSLARGRARVAIGTRAAAFAPVSGLGLVILWGDGEDTLAEPHAPYPNTRDVLAMRSDMEAAAFLLGSHGRTPKAQHLLAAGWAREIAPTRQTLRAAAPRAEALTPDTLAAHGPAAAARIPEPAWRAVSVALTKGPVLVQVPRAGFLPAVGCARCRAPASCAACHGPLGVTSVEATPQCRWCGRLAAAWECPECGAAALRAVTVGAGRTAEELGRAFPKAQVILSSASAPGGVKVSVGSRPALVVATPGAEPIAEGGYEAALLLDASTSGIAYGLDAGTQALRRWLAAASLVKPAPAGGRVLLVGDAPQNLSGALVRYDASGFAARELAERSELRLPPAARIASLTGSATAIAAVLARVPLATTEATLGPVPVESHPAVAADTPTLFEDAPVRVLVRVPAEQGRELARQLAGSIGIRSARREPGPLRLRLDPTDLI